MMKTPPILYDSQLATLRRFSSGKVRDIYEVDEHHLLIVATDRLSAFDVVLPDAIPGKGRVLTAVSMFWFERLRHIVANHVTDMPLEQAVPDAVDRARIEGRAMVVKRLQPLPIEAIVRGYLVGSGWKAYRRTGLVCGICLPTGLKQAERLPHPIYTPSTKAGDGLHDENIAFEKSCELIGRACAEQVRDVSLQLYNEAARFALQRGIIIADTKFEFGLDDSGRLHLIDELLTPDSSRFWPVEDYRPGTSPPSFDKQFVRDYLESQEWNKTPPGPRLPPDIIARTAAKYREAEARLLGADPSAAA